MTYKLFIDDERIPYHPEQWVVCRTAQQAIQYVSEHGLPLEMSLDHDLGILCNLVDKDEQVEYYVDHTVMTFLKWLATVYWHPGMDIPEYAIHSQNPVGRANIKAFMDSWAKSTIIS